MESHVKRKDKPGTSKSIQRKRAADEMNCNALTEFDETELLCLPNFNRSSSSQTNENKMHNEYPENYNVKEYVQLKTPEERRKYRNAKDLRNNIHNKTENTVHGICFTLFRGEKCLDQTCIHGHEFRLPKKLRLCKQWKNGFCANGQICFNLHSEYPCLFHYLGLNNKRHDPKKCPYYHGGPLSKEYEEMFLNSINLNHYPLANEMYKNQALHLKETVCNSVDAAHKANTTCDNSSRERHITPKIQSGSMSLVERVSLPKSELSSEPAVKSLLNESEVYEGKAQELSDESSLMIAEKYLESESTICKQKERESSDEIGLKTDIKQESESIVPQQKASDEIGLKTDVKRYSESLVHQQKDQESSDESSLIIDEE